MIFEMEIPDYLSPVNDLRIVPAGSVVRRINNEKDQQGFTVQYSDEYSGLILVNIVNISEPCFLAENGILKVAEGDKIFLHKHNFKSSPLAGKAINLIQNWALYTEHTNLQNDILEFVKTAYSPEQIIDFKMTENLPALFVPIQERFKIGKFKAKINWNKVREEKFAEKINALVDGKHLTYVAFIPNESVSDPLFYSIGTKPHIETMKKLADEPFGFRPNHGGHIKIVSAPGEPREFIVDAGSNELGSGIHTSITKAEMISNALLEYFPDYKFNPVPGRDAFGIQQSY